MPTFVQANLAIHRDILVLLNEEYLTWVDSEGEIYFGTTMKSALGITIAEYVPTVLDKICGDLPPKGVFYIVESDGETVGMGGLHGGQAGMAQIKRVYVRPNYRGKRLGAAIVQRLLADAREFGYETVRLDTAPFMHVAHRIYENAGFVECAAYEGAEVPEFLHSSWRFMEKKL